MGQRPPTWQEVHTMGYFHPESEWPDFDPPPTVTTIEELEIADELRRALESKYLGKAAFSAGYPAGDSYWGDGGDA